MWDEIKMSLPASTDPRALVERIQKALMEETQKGADMAVGGMEAIVT